MYRYTVGKKEKQCDEKEWRGKKLTALLLCVNPVQRSTDRLGEETIVFNCASVALQPLLR